MTARQKFTVILGTILISDIIVNGTAILFKNMWKKGTLEYAIVSPLADPIGTSKQVFSSLTKEPISQVIEKAQAGTKGKYAIVIKHFDNGITYTQQEHTKYLSGSLYKLWVMAVVYEQIEKGKLKEADMLHAEIPELNKKFDIATESAELTEGEITMTVGQALSQMITISHNYSALLLSDKVGLKNVAAFLQKEGLKESNIGQPPKTSAHDTALFFEKLYNGKLVSKQASENMLALLKKQQLNDRIPKYLPDEIAVAHKTGEIDYAKHDAGIVFSPTGDYIVVVLSESTDPRAAAERIATVSQTVYEYFQAE